MRRVGGIIGRDIASPIVEAMDINAILQEVDWNDVLDDVDVDALCARVDWNKVLDRVDADRHLDRVVLE